MSKGRGNSNSLTIKETVRINIDSLKRSKCLNKGAVTSFKSEWSGGASLMGIITYTEKEKTLTLKYLYCKKPMEYKIQIVEVKSNLDKGVNLYFICPVTNNRCKTIFCCYGSEIFKSRQAYNRRLYYTSQICSKVYRSSTRYNSTESKVNQLQSMRRAKNYKGKETKRHKRLIKLIDKKIYLDELRNDELMQYLEKNYLKGYL